VHGVEGLQRVCDHCYSETGRGEGARSSAGAEGSDVNRASSLNPPSTNLEDGGLVTTGGAGAGAVGADKEEASVAPTAIIPLELASKYTYFKGSSEPAGSQAASRSLPAGQSHRAPSPPASPRRASGRFEGGDGSSTSWHWILGGKGVFGGSSAALSHRQEEGDSESEAEHGRHSADGADKGSDDARAMSLSEDELALSEACHGAREASDSISRKEGRDESVGQVRDTAVEEETGNWRAWDPRKTDDTLRGGGADFGRVSHEVLHGRLCAER
jgi:hypothetical protein